MEINIIVPGEPVAQGRPKFTTKPFVRAYDPPKSAAYKKLVARVEKTFIQSQSEY